MNNQKVGFIGLGNMGFPMAQLLLNKGYEVYGFDVDEDTCKRFSEIGGIYSSITELAGRLTTIILMLPNSTIVNDIVGKIGEAYRQSRRNESQVLTIIDMSSSFPMDTQKNGHILEQAGIEMLDAPVSGGVKKAITGELAIMIGGKTDIYQQQLPLLEALGKHLFHVGPLGSGHTIKALNNFLSASHLLATCEAVRILSQMGIDPAIGIGAFNQSSGKSFSTEYKFPSFILPESFNSGFSLQLLAKDVGLTKQLSEQLGNATPLIQLISHTYDQANEKLDEKADHTEIYRFVSTYI